MQRETESHTQKTNWWLPRGKERDRIKEEFGASRYHSTLYAKSLQSCPTVCNRVDRSPPASSVHRLLQARLLEWVAMPSSSRGSSRPRYRTQVSHIAGGLFIRWATMEAQISISKSLRMMEDRREEDVQTKKLAEQRCWFVLCCVWLPLLSCIWAHYSQPSPSMNRWVDGVEVIGKSNQSVTENKGKCEIKTSL